MLVLGIDPGTATCGYGVITMQNGREKTLDYGAILTPPDWPMPRRLLHIGQALQMLIDRYQPDALAVEELFYQKNAKTVITVAQARGVILYTGAKNSLPIGEYTPLQVKQSVVGYGRADKRQVQSMVMRILHLKEIPKPDDAADALAVALCHLHTSRMKKAMGEEENGYL